MSDAPMTSELFALHLLGALDGAEAAGVAARYTARRAEDVAAIVEAEALVANLAHAAPRVQPPAGARARLLASIASAPGAGRPEGARDAATPPSRRAPGVGAPSRPRWLVRVRLAPVLVVAALVSVAVLAFALLRPTPPAPVADGDLLAVTRDPAAPRWVLADPSDAARPPLATVYEDRTGRRLVLVAPRLASPGAGRSYVLWTIGKEPGAAPRNVGALPFTAGNDVLYAVGDAPALAELSAVAISIEANPRAVAPTATQIIAFGKAPGG
jgi:hypothetical protein